jgi:hypothetical protein
MQLKMHHAAVIDTGGKLKNSSTEKFIYFVWTSMGSRVKNRENIFSSGSLLKGQCHEILTSVFFHESVSLSPK